MLVPKFTGFDPSPTLSLRHPGEPHAPAKALSSGEINWIFARFCGAQAADGKAWAAVFATVRASLAGFRLVIADHAMGLPVLRTLSLCTCCRHYPGAAAGRTLRSASPSRISLPRKGCPVGLRIVLFEACSAFTRVTACKFALSPIRDTLIEGFSHFVTSIAAPVASGWSVSPGGACTHWKAPAFHGARVERTRYARSEVYRS